MSKLSASLTILLLATGFSFSTIAADPKPSQGQQADTHKDAATDAGPVLEKLDTDQDGYVNKQEAAKMDGLSDAFEAADANKDGKLDSAELSKLMTPTTQ